MWQKCWNTNQSLVHNLRFRERGPLKSWRPETMAEAILSVLKEGLSLSQAARKYDIPYPTFVLYANRVHNMLGPSADGGTDLRPKGRGRPQRILLGIWPEEHIRGVIRAVVFRDPQHIKEDTINLGYPRIPGYKMGGTKSVHSCRGGGGGVGAGGSGPGAAPGGGVSPNSAAAAAVVAVAQGLRQQMLAAAQHHDFGGFLAAQCAAAAAAAATGNGTAGHMLHSPLPSPVDSSPRSSPLAPNNNLEVGGVGLSGYKPMLNDSLMPTRSGEHHLFHDEIEDLVKRPQPNDTPKIKPVMGFKPLGNDLSTTRADHLFHDDMEPMMKRPHAPETPKVKVSKFIFVLHLTKTITIPEMRPIYFKGFE
ncbi:hypothetical protein AAG570_011882 [Ranatra chinensis]|uniref:HTH psq-type domain-containing protein n=1 Tax=Ranatra chinensis TaxID=642074 RepID=A0ABD0YH70_9HEMI